MRNTSSTIDKYEKIIVLLFLLIPFLSSIFLKNFDLYDHDINISNEKDIELKNNYLSLTKLVSYVISNLLEVLAIKEVERM